MMKINFRFSHKWLVMILATFLSCDQVFEEDLSGIEVEIISPKDNALVSEETQTFWWKEVDDILSYRVVIVKPSFDDPEFIVLDTTLSELRFDLDVTNLDSSQYQWRVQGVSGESLTRDVAHTFVVTGGKILTGQKVNLLAPADNAQITEADQTFWWNNMVDADYYRLIIVTPSFSSADRKLVFDTVYTDDDLQFTYDVSDLDSAVYEWTVLGVSGNNYSDTTKHSFVITGEVSLNGQKVVLVSPANNREFSVNEIELEWETLNGADDYLIQYDTDIDDIYDGNGTEVVRTGGKSGEIEFQGNEVEYFWRVKGRNSLGSSQYSTIRRFYIDTTLTN